MYSSDLHISDRAGHTDAQHTEPSGASTTSRVSVLVVDQDPSWRPIALRYAAHVRFAS